MADEKVLHISTLAEALDAQLHLHAFLLKGFFPLYGDIVLGMVASNEHQRHKHHAASLGLPQLLYNIVEGREAFDGTHMAAWRTLFHQPVHLRIDGIGGMLRAVTYEDDMRMLLRGMGGCKFPGHLPTVG